MRTILIRPRIVPRVIPVGMAADEAVPAWSQRAFGLRLVSQPARACSSEALSRRLEGMSHSQGHEYQQAALITEPVPPGCLAREAVRPTCRITLHGPDHGPLCRQQP